MEITTDGGQTWRPASGTTSWSYTWDTQNSPNGVQNLQVRTTDNAGLTTQRVVSTGVDNRGPRISLPDSWYQWDSVELNIWDGESGLAEARVEISDPEGRWPARIIRLETGRFPLDFKWDRRFGDDTVAPLGTYKVKVLALDAQGNATRETATINILLGMLPAGPTATPQPVSSTEAAPTATSIQAATPTATQIQTPVVSAFGMVDPTPSAIQDDQSDPNSSYGANPEQRR